MFQINNAPLHQKEIKKIENYLKANFHLEGSDVVNNGSAKTISNRNRFFKALSTIKKEINYNYIKRHIGDTIASFTICDVRIDEFGCSVLVQIKALNKEGYFISEYFDLSDRDTAYKRDF